MPGAGFWGAVFVIAAAKPSLFVIPEGISAAELQRHLKENRYRFTATSQRKMQ